MNHKTASLLPLVQDRISRRLFLRGLGSATMALPFLPSLASPAMAASHSYKRVLFVSWSHGVCHQLFKPSFTAPLEQLAPGVMGRSLNDATFNLYMGRHFDDLRAKFSLLSGISQLGAWGHSPAIALAASERINADKLDPSFPDSIDTIMAESASFYPTPPNMDVLRFGSSFSFRERKVVKALDTSTAFETLFGDGFPADDAPKGPSPQKLKLRRQKHVVEQTLSQYKRLRASGRLSAEDIILLDQSVAHYAEMETRLQQQIDAQAPQITSTACSPFSVTGSDETDKRREDEVNLFTQAFGCDLTRLGVWGLSSTHSDDGGAHKADSQANREGSGVYSQKMISNFKWIAHLMKKWDTIIEGNGKSMLDNALIFVTSDMATSTIGTHPGIDAPFLIAGGLDGDFNMGKYIDFFDRTPPGDLTPRRKYLSSHARQKGIDLRGGPPHNELMISVMRACGLSPSDWERNGGKGFGSYKCEGNTICTDNSKGGEAQSAYVEYYREDYLPKHKPGKELDYFRKRTS